MRTEQRKEKKKTNSAKNHKANRENLVHSLRHGRVFGLFFVYVFNLCEKLQHCQTKQSIKNKAHKQTHKKREEAIQRL